MLTGESNVEFDESGTYVFYGDSTHYYFHTVTAIKDLQTDSGNILIYPNPTSGKITISSDENIHALEIYNLLGERIYTTSVDGQHDYDINLTGYAKGIYMIRVQGGIKMHSCKMVLQ